MHILLVSTGVVAVPPLRGGAVESYVWDLASILAREGHRVTLVSNPSDATGEEARARNIELVLSGSPVDRFPLRPELSALAHVVGGTLSALATARYIARGNGPGPHTAPDVLHLNEEVSAAILSRTAPTIPKVLTIHNPPLGLTRAEPPWTERMFREGGSLLTLRFSLRRADRVIALSSAMKEFLVQRWNVDPSEVEVLPLPIDVHRYTPPDSTTAHRRGLLYVGRLAVRKNPLAILRALQSIHNGVTLTIVGSGSLGGDLRAYVRRAGLENRVTFQNGIGVNALIDLLRSSEMLILPSVLEVYPRVVIEAASCGLPVVLPESPVFSDFLSQGFVQAFDPGRESSLATEVSSLHFDPSRRFGLSTAAREFAVRFLSYESYYRRLARVYSDVAG